MVEATGFAPLAARPGAQPTGRMQFASLRYSAFLHTQTVCSRKRLHPQIPSGTCTHIKKRNRKKILFLFLVEATGFEPTTSWSRTASRQDKFSAYFPFGKHAAPMSAAPFPQKALRPFWGAPDHERAWRWDTRGRVLRSHSNKQNTHREKSLWVFWSRRRDLNPRPLGPEPSALPNCATPRSFAAIFYSISKAKGICKQFCGAFQKQKRILLFSCCFRGRRGTIFYAGGL